MAKNWMELNLSKDEEEIVRQGAALYKTIYLDTIDNVFVIARAVKIVHERHYVYRWGERNPALPRL